jgi:DnaK suppressor protein
MTSTSATSIAKKKLLHRRESIARIQHHNESDSQTLREDERDSEERASNEGIATVLLTLSERERRELKELDHALQRIADGTWGRCEKCNGPIGRQRLNAMPEARTCISCGN